MRISNKKIIISAIIVTAVAVISISLNLYLSSQSTVVQGQTSVVPQQMSLKQLANKLTPIYPQISVVNGSLNTIDGIELKQVSSSTESDSINDTNGIHKPISKVGLAQMVLYYGINPNGQNIVEATLTNTGTTTIYVKELTLGGETPSGIATLGNSGLDSDYSPDIWGKIPKPTITKLVTLTPNQSISEYMEGNWTEPVTNQPFTKLGGGALFFYDKGTTTYNNGLNWSIGVQHDFSQIIFNYSNKTTT
jgi:hypothetical protein